jgi:NADPH:quinone reductase-like Zn-dependent oxidoreductase
MPVPLIPLSDGAGEIAAVGESVTQWQLGGRVAGTFPRFHRGSWRAEIKPSAEEQIERAAVLAVAEATGGGFEVLDF